MAAAVATHRIRCIVQRTLHSLQLTPHTVQRTPHIVQRTPHIVQRTPHIVQRTPHIIQRTVHSLHRTPHRARWKVSSRLFGTTTASGQKLVLGIETSCDDTGIAIVNDKKDVLGESLHSQIRTHVQHGGIIPPVARDLHKEHIDRVISEAMRKANLNFGDLDAVAVSIEPGLVSSLRVGLDKAIDICKTFRKPLIPIHHMKAHALTIRLLENVEFPFMVLLASGGHCLLAVAKNVEDFVLLGTSLDDAPGECLDKVARKLKLKLLPGFEDISGGQAIEKLAFGGDPKKHAVHTTMSQIANCNFSFAGIKNNFNVLIQKEEKSQNCGENDIISNLSDICASVQYSIAHHLCRRLQRALVFCDMKELLPHENRTLVLSGGVGSNQFIRGALSSVCKQYGAELRCPPPNLCTDNGVMIAWNGMEKLLINRDLVYGDYDELDVKGRSPMGPNLSDEISESHIVKLQKIKLV